jgi:isopenicillin N synthase-like dioxygenase
LILLGREIIETYAQAIHELAIDLGRKLAKSVGLVSDLFKGWPCQFRINKYNFTPETVGSSGVQIHTDSGFLTILQDDENVGGLEVMDKSGAFVSVDPCPGTLLVNLGDVAKVRILVYRLSSIYWPLFMENIKIYDVRVCWYVLQGMEQWKVL